MIKNIFPVFETERLLLREITEKDVQKIFDLFSSEAVTRYYDFAAYTDSKQAEEYISRFSNAYKNNEMIRWGIVLKETDTLIGTCGLHTWHQQAQRIEIGFDLQEKYWGKGIMREAVSAVVEFGFSQLNVHRIEALIMLENSNSARLLTKLGFTEEGVRRDYGFWKDKFWDVRCFSLLTTEFSVR